VVNKSKFALSALIEVMWRFYGDRMERALMRFAPTRCPDVPPPASPRGIIHSH
jgi:hypothetical protein